MTEFLFHYKSQSTSLFWWLGDTKIINNTKQNMLQEKKSNHIKHKT